MTDVTGKTTEAAPRPRKTGTGVAAAGGPPPEPRTIADPTPTDTGPSAHGDVSSPSAGAAAGGSSAAGAGGATLREEDSVLVAGLEKAQSTATDLRAWAWLRQEEARDAVRSHPLVSSVMVFGAGMIFGLLLARR